ncbi:YopT-type cysteine protease domain-containing protein [Azospirillum sp. TSO35-2]|uniref:YopT-type cysteine protease domain-containing protein n=1 Tax=Azospirillum sp. TSO35-2 TaxID=716796 RepID=UPI001304EFE8|nr:YopT-type cysteine protease domain-containing protein [Azospirillum sp. TSO35-2]
MAAFDSYCVAPFKQRLPIQRLFPDDHEATKGICFGLSLEWIKRHRSHKGETSKTRIAYIDQDSTILHASIKQRLYSAELHHDLDLSSEQFGSRNQAMGQAGFQIGSTKTQWVSATDPDSVKEVIKAITVATASPHTYHVITLNFTARGAAHATCCYKSGGKAFGLGSHLYFFDPNYGEYKASSGNVGDLFGGLINQYRNYQARDGSKIDYKVKEFVVQSVSFT